MPIIDDEEVQNLPLPDKLSWIALAQAAAKDDEDRAPAGALNDPNEMVAQAHRTAESAKRMTDSASSQLQNAKNKAVQGVETEDSIRRQDLKDLNSQTLRALPLSPEAYNAVAERAYKDPYILEQRKALQDMENQYTADLNKPRPLNYGPLLGLVDSWTGSQLAKNYKAPMSDEDRSDKLLKLQDLVVKQKNAIQDNLTNLIRAQIGPDRQVDTVKQINDIVTTLKGKDKLQTTNEVGRSTPRATGAGNAIRLEKDLRTDIDKNVITPITHRSEQFGIIDDAFKTGDYQAINSVLSQFSRGVAGEKGVLTDQDIVRVMPRSFEGDVAKWKAYISNTPSAQMPPEYVDSLRNMVGIARQNAAKVYGEMLESKERLYRASPSYQTLMQGGGSEMFKTARDRVTSFGDQGGSKPKFQRKDTSKMTLDEKKAYLQELQKVTGGQ
jgi:hypothetical protein